MPATRSVEILNTRLPALLTELREITLRAGARRVVGHIAFSPITISDGSLNWYCLGPISVLPEYQKQGIGKSLILKGLSLLKGNGGEGCALVGEPDYYKRFGFKNIPDLIHEGIPQEVFLALPFGKNIPRGTVAFHEGFWVTC